MEKSTCDCCKNVEEIYYTLVTPSWTLNEKGELEYTPTEYKVCFGCYVFANNSGAMLQEVKL